METIQVKTNRREELVNITGQVQNYIDKSGVKDGVILLFVPHTTAGLTINENADPAVRRDIVYKMNKEIPQSDGYHHSEGNSDAHIKSSLFGPSLPVIIADGRLVLGTWQSIYFCEFDGPRTRRLHLKIISD
jgi:secondary thiamine-phosphate synthase enzyme